MRDTQDKFMAAIGLIASVYGLEVVRDAIYGNTGFLTFSRETDFNVLGRLHYGFYQQYASVEGTIGKLDFKRGYVKPEEMQSLVDDIREAFASEYPRRDP